MYTLLLSLKPVLCISVCSIMQDRALPIAVKSNNVHTRLRLCNKLTELMLNLKLYGQAVEFAQIALDISITLGMNICHKVHN